jgi:hypothetical protein
VNLLGDMCRLRRCPPSRRLDALPAPQWRVNSAPRAPRVAATVEAVTAAAVEAVAAAAVEAATAAAVEAAAAALHPQGPVSLPQRPLLCPISRLDGPHGFQCCAQGGARVAAAVVLPAPTTSPMAEQALRAAVVPAHLAPTRRLRTPLKAVPIAAVTWTWGPVRMRRGQAGHPPLAPPSATLATTRSCPWATA